jgi:hypothetical protein
LESITIEINLFAKFSLVNNKTDEKFMIYQVRRGFFQYSARSRDKKQQQVYRGLTLNLARGIRFGGALV